MSLVTLKLAILQQAEATASALLARSAEHVKNEQQKTTSQLREFEDSIIGHARTAGERLARIIHQKAELAGRAIILNAKQEELEKTVHEFTSHLLRLDAKKSKQLHEALLKTLPSTKGEIIAGEHSKSVITEIVKNNHVVSKDVLVHEGGFIFRGNKVEINATFLHLAHELIVNHRAEIAHELFS